jgi:hypothetical protein
MTPVFLVIVMMESLEAYYDVVSVGEACPCWGLLRWWCNNHSRFLAFPAEPLLILFEALMD